MHSYGGMVGTEAVVESLSKKSRSAKGEKGSVVQLLYKCELMLQKGQSSNTTRWCATAVYYCRGISLQPLQASRTKTFQDDGTCSMLDPKARFYQDLPPAEAERWESLLRPHPAIAQLTPLTNEAFRYVPSTYLYCENDAALPIFVQKDMVEKTGVEVKG